MHASLVALIVALAARAEPRAAVQGPPGDPTVPRGPKVALAIGVVWLISPIDLLPEFLPVLGPLDDAVVAALVLRYLVKRAGVEVVRTHWRGEPATLATMLRAARIG